MSRAGSVDEYSLAKGDVFTHNHHMDVSWRPQPGQTWAKDAPRATMVVTKVTERVVYYTTLGDQRPGAPLHGRWYMSRDHFFREYGV